MWWLFVCVGCLRGLVDCLDLVVDLLICRLVNLVTACCSMFWCLLVWLSLVVGVLLWLF